MLSFIRIIVNSLYILVIIFVVLSVSAYAFVEKSAKPQTDSPMILGKVIKEEVAHVSPNSGIVKTVDPKVGERVKVNDQLVIVTQNVTSEKENEDTSSESALSINSTTEGVVQKVYVKKGQTVVRDQALVNIINDNNSQVLINVNEENYTKVKGLKDIIFYSKRLDQSFAVELNLLNPSVMGAESSSNTFQLSYTFKNPIESKSLLHNEKLELFLPEEKKGIDIKELLTNFIN